MSGVLRLPWMVLFLVGILIAAGVTFIHSGTSGTHLDGLAMRQLLAAAMATPFLLGAAVLGPAAHARSAPLYYCAMLLALVAVLFVGVEIHHARRWFQGPAGFLLQPSELAKPVFILMLARFLHRRGEARHPLTLLGVAVLTALPFLLIRAEPDLGTALMFLPIAAGMAFVAGARRTWFLAFGVAGLVGASALYHSPLLHDYQKERVRTFLVSIPERTAEAQQARRDGRWEEAATIEQEVREIKRNAGYQSHTAQTSIGSGGWFGHGLGEGPQNRLRTLPERHNDFIFSVIAEETGWMGGTGLVMLYLLLGMAILQVAAATRDGFGQLVCAGVAVSLLSQAFGNVAMNAGLLPITGMPLPFVSQGGSSMMSSLAMVGLVVSVARSRHFDQPFAYATGPVPDPFGFRVVEASRKRLRFR